MGDLWIQMLTHDDRDRRVLSAAIEPKEMMEDLVGFEVMIRRDPSNFHLHNDAALLYMNLGRYAQAIVHFEATAALTPDSAPAHFNLGTALALAGRREEAIAQYHQALALNPDYALAHNNLGDALLLQGKTDEALQHFHDAVRLDPRNVEAHYNVGSVAIARGDVAAAIKEFREAVSLKDNSGPALVGLAWLLATVPDSALRDPAEAVRLATHAADLSDRRDPRVLDLLAAAYASSGDFDRAVATAQAALDLKPHDSIAVAIRQRQELYRQRHAFVAP